MMLQLSDHARYLRACSDPRASEEERALLAYCASMAAAGEPITRAEYLRAESIVGGALSSDVTPLHMRPMPSA